MTKPTCFSEKSTRNNKKPTRKNEKQTQTACLVVNPIKVNSFAYLFNCTTVGRASDWMTVPS